MDEVKDMLLPLAVRAVILTGVFSTVVFRKCSGIMDISDPVSILKGIALCNSVTNRWANVRILGGEGSIDMM